MGRFGSTSNHFFSIFIVIFPFILPYTKSLSFNFSSFDSNTQNISYEGDAFPSNIGIQLTKNQKNSNLRGSIGRAYYSQPLFLWDNKTGKVTNFTTHFSFIIKQVNNKTYGDGLTFFIVPVNSSIPSNSSGGYLGLVSPWVSNNTQKNQFVAVEFDSFKNPWDPSSDHVGIDVNSIVSVTNVTWNSSIKDGRKANAWVTYSSSTQNLSVFLTYADNPVFNGSSSLFYSIDLSKILPQMVTIGFSASTGLSTELHQILSWDFDSDLEEVKSVEGGGHGGENKRKSKIWLVVGVISGFGALVVGVGAVLIIRCRKRADGGKDDVDFDVDDEFEEGAGPKRFSYSELSKATNSFSDEGKLGEGGFGSVYVGRLMNPSREIAVKCLSRGSKQGKKEYVSEVKIISRLRHRNLVQLLGWCHEKEDMLLVYEFMPNRSLDYHLYGGKGVALTWSVRYKITLGLASALLYLHEEWEQCVVHRDIKSSNVMLDSNFNTKLGDFGLARLVDHERGLQTTVLAGTWGYLAPECVITGKASKESDVYSFGVVALEIACGRRPVEPREELSKVRLVEWVWDLYGKGILFEAVDTRLNGEFDEQQVECLMVIGLWCCHPDYTFRPSIKQVINVLNFESPLPNLPPKFPVPVYFNPSIDLSSYTSSGVGQSQTSGSSGITKSSSQSSGVSSSAPLLSQKYNA